MWLISERQAARLWVVNFAIFAKSFMKARICSSRDLESGARSIDDGCTVAVTKLKRIKVETAFSVVMQKSYSGQFGFS
jgi:hypothetical protein